MPSASTLAPHGERSERDRVLLQARDITKDFPGVRALDGVDFELRAGEVHVLFGENGAGKSTLISILAGAHQPTSGALSFKEKAVELASVHQARDLGISAVFQEFSLIPRMTVEENLVLGAEPRKGLFLDHSAIRREAHEILDALAFDIDPSMRIDRLTRAEQQMVEIAKAFRSDLSVLILDEPTASLTSHETDHLFGLIGELTASGVGIVYITHRMAEIRRIADRITVLRDGRYIDTVAASSTSEDDLVSLMTGRIVGEIFPRLDLNPPGEQVLLIENVSALSGNITDVSLHVLAGEIIGLAGLVGSGKSQIMQACFGAGTIDSGRIVFCGKDIRNSSPADNIRDGFLYLPSDRRNEGLLMMRSARENMALAALNTKPFSRGIFLDRTGERRAVDSLAARLNLSPRRIERAVDRFSGGNQQKVMLARSLTRAYRLLVFDEPTVGVDVGTRAAIYDFIVGLANKGVAIILVSSDLPEILNLTSRAYVFYRGRIQVELPREQLTEENVLAHFFEREAV